MSARFKKQELIGSGSFGKVYLAISSENRQKYAVKEVKVSGLSTRDINQVMTEVSVLAYSKHVNIIRYKVAYMEIGLLNIVMEYADNGDLYQRIRLQKKESQHLPENVILNWFVQICSGIRYLHAKNILHRDLKSQNIFLTKNQTVKIGDFGISKILENTADQARTAIGTPYYLSPEICQRLPYNQKSDLWAAGCVLYELACLDYPFQGTNFNDLLVTILHGKFKPLPKQYTPLMKDLVCVLLNANCDQRPTAEQVLCIPALKKHVDGYINHLQTTLPASPKPSIDSVRGRLLEKENLMVRRKELRRKHSLSTPKGRQPLGEKRCHSVNENSEPRKKLKSEIKPGVKTSLHYRAVNSRQHQKLATSLSPINAQDSDVEMNDVFSEDAADKDDTDNEEANKSKTYVLQKAHFDNDVLKKLHHFGLGRIPAVETAEGLRYFLEQKMGCDRFFRLYIAMKDSLLSREDCDKFRQCSKESGVFWPVLFHLIQLDSLPQ